EERQALQLFFMRASIGRPFVAPPGVPPDRVAALRGAFDATMHDPAFLADAARLQLNVVPLTGQQLFNLVARAYATPPAIVKRAMQAMGR
ncbi:MAG: Bug family tripartite tricarboxylate transporter substrate binding protein, partial [Pseudomonadota bacterium]